MKLFTLTVGGRESTAHHRNDDATDDLERKPRRKAEEATTLRSNVTLSQDTATRHKRARCSLDGRTTMSSDYGE